MTSSLDRAREHFAHQAWRQARLSFASAAEEAPLEATDHERFAVAAFLTGDDEVSEREWAAAHRCSADDGDPGNAARCCVLLALSLFLRGQAAGAAGWLTRADGLVADAPSESAAHGYVLVPRVLGALAGGDATAARELAVATVTIGRGADDADLDALGRLGHGQALIALGETDAGVARLDEVMVAVTGGEVGPIVAGIAYCAVIVECLGLFDLARATEWTETLGTWCDRQPDLVPFRGQCLVHRSQLQLASGRWTDALATVAEARARLADPPHPALGLACYQQAELFRLRGDLDRAESAYRASSRHGHHPMPGLALLELARGHTATAAATIERALLQPGRSAERPTLLAAAVDIFREAGDLTRAGAAARELADVATGSRSPLLAAMVDHAAGTVELAEGDGAAALVRLREAAQNWQALRLPYEAARTAAALGLAYVVLGDRTAASLELDNAATRFRELGAGPDLQRLAPLEALVRPSPAGDGLSAREREVLVHLAGGKSNRQIAAALSISQHTVGRHVENIFVKLGVHNRAAATAWAYEHHLLPE